MAMLIDLILKPIIIDESSLTLTETEILDAVIEMENNDFDDENGGEEFDDNQD